MKIVAQLDLFNARARYISLQRRRKIDERFAAFHRDNPHVYRLLVDLAREYIEATGRDHIGMKMLWETLRFRVGVHTRGQGDYTLNNDFTARYARLIVRQEPDLAGAFELRRLRERVA